MKKKWISRTFFNSWERIAKIGKRKRSKAPYFDVIESPRNCINNSTVDFKLNRRLETDGVLKKTKTKISIIQWKLTNYSLRRKTKAKFFD